MKYRIYLDNCYFNRPYDDQSHLLVQLETESKLFIQQAVLQGLFELAWSYMLDYENAANPYQNRRNVIAKWKNAAVADVNASERVLEHAREFTQQGIKKKDALHIACAVEAKCTHFLSTDKKLLKATSNEIIIVNPIDFIKILKV